MNLNEYFRGESFKKIRWKMVKRGALKVYIGVENFRQRLEKIGIIDNYKERNLNSIALIKVFFEDSEGNSERRK